MLYNLQKKVHDFWSRRHLVVLSLMAVLCASSAAMTQADALYILTGAEDSAIVLDGSKSVEDFSSQLVYLSSGSKGYDVTLFESRDEFCSKLEHFFASRQLWPQLRRKAQDKVVEKEL